MLSVLVVPLLLCVPGQGDRPETADTFQAALVAAVHRFAEDGELDHLRAVLVKYPKLINAKQVFRPPHKPLRGDGFTALHRAAERGQEEVVTYLIEKGAEVNGADGLGWTPLHLAARQERLAIVKLLVKAAERGQDQEEVVTYLISNLAADLKELTRGKGRWRGNPVKIKRELTGKVEQVTPALAFLPIDQDPKPDEEQLVIIGVDDAGNTVGRLATFKLAQEGPKRFILLNVGDKHVRLWYSLRGGRLKIAGDTKISVRGEGEIDLTGEWGRKD